MAKKKALPEVVVHNFVAKHMHEVNKSQVFVDRKREAKRGYSKHKKGRYSNDYLPFLMEKMTNLLRSHYHYSQSRSLV